MKLNFWQWLGVVLLIGGVALWIYERREKPAPTTPTTPTTGQELAPPAEVAPPVQMVPPATQPQ